MSLITIFDIAWHSDAIAVCVAALGLLCRLRMQPVAQVARVCASCQRVARGSDEEHGNVTLKLIVVQEGRR